ncbi:MAG: hypothetical protein ACLSVX_12395 [Massilimicrobiota timonensis]
MNDKLKLKCNGCGNVLEITFGYDGCDWHSEAGEGSGYGYEVGLVCNHCGNYYPIVRTKGINDAICVEEKIRPYNK